jgi:hypothetical protein
MELGSCWNDVASVSGYFTSMEPTLLHNMLQYFHCGVSERLQPPHRPVKDTGLFAFFCPLDFGRRWTAGCPLAWYC